jgi:tripartite-type tricarboxylate transporter receptor subunit TctC
MLRLIEPTLRRALGQPVIIDNRATILLGELGAKAPPDGYTMIVVGTSFFTGNLVRDTNWDPIRDFLPVTLACAGPSVLVVHPSVPANSVKELIALAKARPGAINYATGAPGSTAHLATELLKAMAGGIKLTWVPYKDNGPGLRSVMAGETQMMITNMPGIEPLKQMLFNSGVVVVGSTPEEFGRFMKSSVAKWGKVIKDAGIRVN